MPHDQPLFTIVLAAGKGRRMRNRYMHKVCFDVAGNLTIVRALDTFNRFKTLIDDLLRGDPSRAAQAQLHHQPGAYRCSIREIDALVDIAARTPGVLGAQIAGAGLGGCAMVLSKPRRWIR